MEKTGVKWIDRSLIRSPYYIGLCQSEKAFKRELKRLKVPRKQWPAWITSGKDATTYFFEKSKVRACIVCIVCIRNAKERNRCEIVGLLVHEAVHVWHAVKRDMGERKPSAEFEAYSIQHIAQGLIAACK